MLCLGALAVSKSFSLRNIIFFVILSTGFYLLIGITAEIALGTFRPFATGYRFAGTIHPSSQGVNCALLLLSSITAFQSVKRGRILFLVCMLIGFVFLILTKSRTSFTSAMLALFVYWALSSSTSSKITLILVVSLTFCLLILLFGDAFFPAMRQGVLLGREDSSVYTLNGRVSIWNECMEYAAQRPFLGYGYNSFWTLHHIREISDGQGWGVGVGHSIYLDLLLNLGCIGMITFVLIFILGIKKSVNYLKVSSNIGYAFLCALLVFCVLDGILETITIYPSSLMFLSMVILTRLGFQDPHIYKEYS
jgi:O-antigen ligase